MWSCPSPRQYALSLITDDSTSRSALNTAPDSGQSASTSSNCRSNMCLNSSTGSSSESGAESSARSSDRYSGGGEEDSSSSESSDRIHSLGAAPPCVDYDTVLQIEVENPNATCGSAALNPLVRVCDVDTGIILCPKTCNYCAPFAYSPLKKKHRLYSVAKYGVRNGEHLFLKVKGVIQNTVGQP